MEHRTTAYSVTSRKQLEALLLEGLASGEPEEVTEEYLRARDQEIAEMIARKCNKHIQFPLEAE